MPGVTGASASSAEVSNNASWAVGEICIKVPSDPWAPRIATVSRDSTTLAWGLGAWDDSNMYRLETTTSHAHWLPSILQCAALTTCWNHVKLLLESYTFDVQSDPWHRSWHVTDRKVRLPYRARGPAVLLTPLLPMPQWFIGWFSGTLQYLVGNSAILIHIIYPVDS